MKKILIVILLATQLAMAQRTRYTDVLDLKTAQIDMQHITPNVFSDMGAWHAYALPARREDNGAFAGPLLMGMQGKWLSPAFSRLAIVAEGRNIDLSAAEAAVHYYPGLLEQRLQLQGLSVCQQLIFVSGREALLHTTIKNTGKTMRNLSLQYSGSAPGVIASGNTVQAQGFVVVFPEHSAIEADSAGYHAVNGNITLQPGKTFTHTQVQAYYPGKSGAPAKYVFAAELKKNTRRWNGYLQRYFSQAPELDSLRQRLAVKCIVTLITNWRSASKDMLHDGVFPSVNYQGFYGVWSWDSWKQAAGIATFSPQLAKENIRCMFDYQDEAGMIADCIYADKKENNWRDTKPPLAAWAVWQVYQQEKDKQFVEEMLPKLIRYHRWWYAHRDHDRNGLCEYGSTDGTRIAAAWESGMDNAVRFDSAVMLRNNNNAWSLNQESVDLNAYLYAEKLYLSRLCEITGDATASRTWVQEAQRLQAQTSAQFYDQGSGYFHDKMIGARNKVRVYGTEGWIPLWAGTATPAQAAAVKRRMEDPAKFNTKVPLPTLAADHPAFDPMRGYWRGPVWLDQFAFGTEGLRRYGYHALATQMEKQLLQQAEGLLANSPVYENYHPLTGKGLNARNFSWSAAHLLLILKNK